MNSNDKSAKQLFFGSIIHLPILLALMMIHKTSKSDQEDSYEFIEVEEEI